jgi:hypothetical protein
MEVLMRSEPAGVQNCIHGRRAAMFACSSSFAIWECRNLRYARPGLSALLPIALTIEKVNIRSISSLVPPIGPVRSGRQRDALGLTPCRDMVVLFSIDCGCRLSPAGAWTITPG